MHYSNHGSVETSIGEGFLVAFGAQKLHMLEALAVRENFFKLVVDFDAPVVVGVGSEILGAFNAHRAVVARHRD